jgi:hypothetical protein
VYSCHVKKEEFGGRLFWPILRRMSGRTEGNYEQLARMIIYAAEV